MHWTLKLYLFGLHGGWSHKTLVSQALESHASCPSYHAWINTPPHFFSFQILLHKQHILCKKSQVLSWLTIVTVYRSRLSPSNWVYNWTQFYRSVAVSDLPLLLFTWMILTLERMYNGSLVDSFYKDEQLYTVLHHYVYSTLPSFINVNIIILLLAATLFKHLLYCRLSTECNYLLQHAQKLHLMLRCLPHRPFLCFCHWHIQKLQLFPHLYHDECDRTSDQYWNFNLIKIKFSSDQHLLFQLPYPQC